MLFTFNMSEEDTKLFANNYIKVLRSLHSSKYNNELDLIISLDNNESQLDNIINDSRLILRSNKSPLDKWDIFAGIILAGALTATVVGVSIAAYYIVTALSNAGIIAFSSTMLTSSMKEKFANFIKKELSWLFEQKLGELSAQKMKEIHSKIKQFLVEHFDNDTQKINDILT